MFAFENRDPRPKTHLHHEFALPEPQHPPCLCPCRDNYFHTSVNLKGLIGIVPCRAAGEGIITGLLLFFRGGHREVVGQVRLDSLRENETVEMNEMKITSLGFNRLEGGFPQLVAISASTQPPQAEETYEGTIELSSSGVLDWYWSLRQCYVMYEGQDSPVPV